jgi:argininosuccinate lyase
VKSGYSFETLRRKFSELVGRALEMSDLELRKVLSPRHFVQVRNVPGGPSISAMESVITFIEEKVKIITDSLNGLIKNIVEREEQLLVEFNGLG